MTAPWEPIAIVGIGGVFPDAPDPDTLWENVRRGVSAAAEVPAERWVLNPDAIRAHHKGEEDRVASTRACLVRDFKFDAAGYEIAPEKLAPLDPLFHLGLTAARQALHHWQGRTANPARIGVIIGNIVLPDSTASAAAVAFQAGSEPPDIPPAAFRGPGLPAGLIARALGLGLGGWAVDAACASSLYAVKLACAELAADRADAMLAGGLARPDSLYTQMGFSQLRALSPSGRCSPFDAKGDGLVVGEGAGILVLRRLADAERDGDRILAVIRGVGTSNDLDGSLLAPSQEGQLRAMREAYAHAGWRDGDVDLFECHATGTPLGDGVEVGSLRALRDGLKSPAILGSVKSNVGHMLTAAGSVGLIKTVLAMQHGELPPTANFEAPSAGVSLEGSGLRVLSAPASWSTPGDRPRRAAVSAFGFGGINAHVLLEAYAPGVSGQFADAPVALSGDEVAAVLPPVADKVAIVGLGVHTGAVVGLRPFQEAAFNGQAPTTLSASSRAGEGHEGLPPLGGESSGAFYASDIQVPAQAFRIPPRELADMLPQQAVMLLAADEAMRDAGGALGDRQQRRPRMGAFIGLGLDARTTDFHRRWAAIAQGETPQTPPLTADRTLGALGGMVASRLAREFRLGGPCHTLQAEEASAFRAFEAGVRALQRHEIDAALVGGVDLAGDLRVLAACAAEGVNLPSGEGAGALVLKRLADAERDGNRIYAVVDGLGAVATDSHDILAGASASAHAQAMAIAWKEAQAQPAGATQLELPPDVPMQAGEASSETASCALARVSQVVGQTGAANGALALIRTALSLYHRILPKWAEGNTQSTANPAGADHGPAFGHLPRAPQYAFRNGVDAPRRAGVSVTGCDGTVGHVVLSEALSQPQAATAQVETERRRPLGQAQGGLFTLAGASPEALNQALSRLEAWVAEQATDTPVATVARGWWQSFGQETGALGLALVANDVTDLYFRIADARRVLAGDAGPTGDTSLPIANIFYAPQPLGAESPIAFVFPGSGNHYAGMGTALWATFPELARIQDTETSNLADQVCPAKVVPWRAAWSDDWQVQAGAALANDHRTTLLAQVAHGVLMHDLVGQFGVKPSAIMGYSLGETAGFVATRTWGDRDELTRRMHETNLFTEELGGHYAAAARVWGLPPGEAARWTLGVVDRGPVAVRAALQGFSRVYLLIVNAPGECVIGGEPEAVETLVARLGCTFLPLEGVTSVHCEVATAVEQAYRDLHDLPVTPPPGVRFYSGRWGESYTVTREKATGSVVSQALEGLDFPALVRAAYADGVRVFIEMGPKGSCSRMIRATLGDRPHLARSADNAGQDPETTLLRLLGHLHAERVPIDLKPLYGVPTKAVGANPEPPAGPTVAVPLNAKRPLQAAVVPVATVAATSPAPLVASPVLVSPVSSPAPLPVQPVPVSPPAPQAATQTVAVPSDFAPAFLWSSQAAATLAASTEAAAQAHAAFLAFQQSQEQTLLAILAMRPALSTRSVSPAPPRPDVFMDREACLAYARGDVGPVLGPYFAPIDAHPTRVRLPDEPLMLVDRIVSVMGERGSMRQGRVVTEHDILPGAWYLDGGRIPTCIAVEAGQADLFLSGWLGIDFKTQGLASYRLLDAIVTFHRELPGPGETIHYDIAIDRFMEQSGVTLFFFNFEATVNGEPLLSMREGCAGFFTPEHLTEGRGIVFTALDLQARAGDRPADWRWLAPQPVGDFKLGAPELQALRAGNLPGAFGPAFAGLPLRQAATLPNGRMRLVDRVVTLEPEGGRLGLGFIRAEHDVFPDAWYLTCHFVDDMVMPGTLMYECCMHTLRIFLMRLGWVGEAGTVVFEPRPGTASRLKCRGQVLPNTRLVTYEITLKGIGYESDGTPFALADALMLADGKPIVLISDMGVRASGLNRTRLENLWQQASGPAQSGDAIQGQAMTPASPVPVLSSVYDRRPALYGPETITAFATGNPSKAFGDRYKPFDQDRTIARLPGPPYQFLDRVTALGGEPWVCKAGAWCEAQYDVPPDAWYFADEGQPTMPFAVLLEIALQPCGWLSAYVGSALTSPIDLSYRNLGGKMRQLSLPGPNVGTLTTHTELKKVSISGGMIVQEFDLRVTANGETVYEGWTMFGFFTQEALAQQVGIRGAATWEAAPPPAAVQPLPAGPLPMPCGMMPMIDGLDVHDRQGGRFGQGYLRGRKRVNPAEWFFAAHFYQDPVCPGSLGLESLLQLLKVEANRRWGDLSPGAVFQSMALDQPHEWLYRGQIVQTNQEVVVEAHIKHIDDATRTLVADGLLWVDGRPIYGMTDFAIRVVWPDAPATAQGGSHAL